MKATVTAKCKGRQKVGILPENHVRVDNSRAVKAAHRVVHVVVKAGRKICREYDLVQEGRVRA